MTIKTLISAGLAACAVLASAIVNSANAQDPVITMSLGDYSSYADVVNLGTMTIPGGRRVVTSGFILSMSPAAELPACRRAPFGQPV